MNRENLKKLADGLRGPLVAEFNMSSFVRTSPNETADEEVTDVSVLAANHCGTAACAAGHATYLVAPKKVGEPFHRYIARVFGLEFHANKLQWIWVFGGMWNIADCSPAGCADRIDWMLEHGAPKDTEEQMMGEAPLCYRTPK